MLDLYSQGIHALEGYMSRVNNCRWLVTGDRNAVR